MSMREDGNGFIAAVRLSDRGESEQPDPLVLSSEEVNGLTWCYFETLLKSMYTLAPTTIQVKYLDDENDWVEMSSDAELREALKYIQDSGELLQLLVNASTPSHEQLLSLDEGKPGDDSVTDSTINADLPNQLPAYYIPTTDPRGDVWQPLRYPHPDQVNSDKKGENNDPIVPMTAQDSPYPSTEFVAKNGPRLVYPQLLPSHAPTASASVWGQASHLNTEGKVQFLKSFVQQSSDPIDKQDPFETYPKQNPFEMNPFSDSSEKTSSILTPVRVETKPSSGKNIQNGISSQSVDNVCNSLTSVESPVIPSMTRPEVSYMSAVVPKAKLPKKLMEPLKSPKNVMMMEGALSGANAVAIEMPVEPDFRGKHVLKKETGVFACGSTLDQLVFDEVCDFPRQAMIVSKQDFPNKQQMERDQTALKIVQDFQCSSLRNTTTRGGEKELTYSAQNPEAEKQTQNNPRDLECDDSKEKKPVCYKDFVKQMKKLKKDIHTSIVKDVTKQTDYLLKKRLARSLSHEYSQSPCKSEGLVIHKGITCDHCDLEIVGIRYKCGNCADFDLCEHCESNELAHDSTHIFLKLRKPALKAGCVGHTRLPLLRENVYEAEKNWEEKKKKSKVDKEKKKKKSKDKEGNTKDGKKGMRVLVEKVSADETSQVVKSITEVEKVSVIESLDQPCEREKPAEETPDAESESHIKMLTVVVKSDDPSTLGLKGDKPQEEELSIPDSRMRCNSNSSSGSSIVQLCVESDFLQQECETIEPCQQLSEFNSGEPSVQEREFDVKENQETVLPDVCELTALVPAQISTAPDNFEPQDNDEASSSSSFLCYESDSSEDFCVIDHLHYEELEDVHQGENESVANESLVSTNDGPNVDGLESPQDEPGVFANDLESESTSTEPVQERNATVLPEEANLQRECRDETSIVHQLNDEEKHHFQELLKAELCQLEQGQYRNLGQQSQKQEEQKVEKKINVNSVQVSTCSEASYTAIPVCGEVKDVEYKEILEVKTMQAVLENTRLEDAALEEEAQRVLDQEDDETKRQRQLDPVCYRIQVTDKRVGQILELEVKKFAALNSGDKEGLAAIEKELQKLDWQQKIDEKRIQLVERENKLKSQSSSSLRPLSRQISSSSTQCETSAEIMLSGSEGIFSPQNIEKKDADCQTQLVDVFPRPTNQLIQHVASGVSKAASSAFLTAKDVFYSLQAKQNEWKASKPAGQWMPKANTFVPVTSSWTPPEDSFTLPKDEFQLPKDDYKPPRNDYVPPSSTWTPPDSKFSPLRTDSRDDTNKTDVDKVQDLVTEVTSDISTTEGRCANSEGAHGSLSSQLAVADSALRQEIKVMQILIEMGFANREQNRKLLSKFNGDLDQVVQTLIQEQEDLWASRRH